MFSEFLLYMVNELKQHFKYKMTGTMPDLQARFVLSTFSHFRRRLLCVLGLTVLLLPLKGSGQTISAPDSTSADQLSGTWVINKERSTAIDPWTDLKIEIDATESRLTLERIWSGYHGYAVSDSMTIPIDGSSHQVPMSQWPDNRQIGAFLASESSKSVSARWLDKGQTLQVTNRLNLSVSQGTSQVRTHREYRVSPTGSYLIVLELRSTRPRPIRYTLEQTEPS